MRSALIGSVLSLLIAAATGCAPEDLGPPDTSPIPPQAPPIGGGTAIREDQPMMVQAPYRDSNDARLGLPVPPKGGVMEAEAREAPLELVAEQPR